MQKKRYDVKAFDRYIDVYMTGAALGALKDKRAKEDGSTDRARIYSDAFNTEHVKCNELFKVVILNDTSKPWSEEDRINICFKYRDKMDANAIPPITEREVKMKKEALDLFNEYVMGGIELLYVIIPELSEPPVRTLGATIPENESHIFR